jgi:hypothetical protein
MAGPMTGSAKQSRSHNAWLWIASALCASQ